MPQAKSVTLRLNIWANPRTGMIHLATSDEKGMISTVSAGASSKRYHPNLFGKLRRILKSAGKWPEGM